MCIGKMVVVTKAKPWITRGIAVDPIDTRIVLEHDHPYFIFLRFCPLFVQKLRSKYTVIKGEDKLIYLRWEDNIENFPNIKKHLMRFKIILMDQQKRYEETYPWYALHRPREQKVFEASEKILVPYRNKENVFGYETMPVYSSRDIFFITEKDKSISLKYILALLNSRPYYLWLYHRGKRKGETLELYQKPLSEIPIKKIHESEQKPFIELVDRILTITKDEDYLQNPQKQAQVKAPEREIDRMVYKLYGLTEEEIRIVEGDK